MQISLREGISRWVVDINRLSYKSVYGYSLEHSLAIIPPWKTSTHSSIFNEICRITGLLPVEAIAPSLGRFSRLSLSSALLVLLHLDKILKCFVLQDIRKFEFEGVNLGHSLNEESIRCSARGHYRLGFDLARDIKKVFSIYLLYSGLLKSQKVRLIIGGDEAYVHFSLLAQLAALNGVPSMFLKGGFSFSAYEYEVSCLNAVLPRVGVLKREFRKLDADVKRNWLSSIESQLIARINGDRAALSYMPPASAIKKKDLALSIPCQAVWLYLHDFYDSPGIYGENIYPSHFLWVLDTILVCGKNNIKLVIKKHPNQRPKNQSIIDWLERISRRYHSVFWLQDDLALTEVVRMKPRFLVSVYGSIIPEAAYAGIPVLSLGRSPYSDYGLAYQVKTKSEYRRIIAGLELSISLSSCARRESVEALAAYRYFTENRLHIPLPYDDISRQDFANCDISDCDYPCFNYERRRFVHSSPSVQEYVRRRLASDDIQKSLRELIDVYLKR